MAFWDGKERPLATWKSLRAFLSEAASDTTCQSIYALIGENMKQPAAMALKTGGLNTAKGPKPRVLSDAQPVPESMSTESRLESAARYFLGLAGTRDVDVVSRILRSLDTEEEQALRSPCPHV